MLLTDLTRPDKMRLNKILTWLIIVFPILYVSSCAITSELKGRAFDAVKIGDTEASVIRLFGNPSVREKPDTLFTRYASNKCKSPCIERLWFENQLSIGIEAWSVELGSDNRVVEKAHWVSP